MSRLIYIPEEILRFRYQDFNIWDEMKKGSLKVTYFKNKRRCCGERLL